MSKLQSTLLGIGKLKNLPEIHLPTPPYCNTGVLGNQISVRSDWINFCLREEKISRNIRTLALGIFRHWFRRGVFSGSKGWNLIGADRDEFKPGFHGFENGCFLRFGEEIRGSIQWGGKSQNGWVQFELCGAFLAILPRFIHLAIYRYACKYEARLNRVDLAADDYLGNHFCPRKVLKDWVKKAYRFLPGHRAGRGSHKPVRDRAGVPETGETAYINRTPDSSIMLRIYDKGLERREKGDLISYHKFPRWVRWETSFKRQKGTVIDYQVLHPDYWVVCMLGSSQYFADIFKKKGLRVIWRLEKAVDEPLERAAKLLLTLERQYGGGIGHAVRVLGLEGFFSQVCRQDSGSYMAHLTHYDSEAVLDKLHDLRFLTLTSDASPELAQWLAQVRAVSETKSATVAPGTSADTVEW
jgi:hypothetical protein